VPALVAVAAFALWVYAGVRAGSDFPTGTLPARGLIADVRIVRDDRGIPHVRAANEHDLFFAEGFLQGSDRLFQLDIYRRLVAGRLAEILGTLALHSDLEARVFSIDDIAGAQFAALRPAQRRNLAAFAAGVNLAIATRPLPPEFRVLGYRPAPWTPQDSLAASFATVLALTDSWNDVATRADVIAALGPNARDAFFSITDPVYDAPTTSARKAPVAPLPPLSIPFPAASPLYVASADTGLADAKAGMGSNEFAAGAERTTTHRALLANDPHLELRMPGVWWLAELDAPGLHVEGATLPGVPGIILGHNAHVAWGATNGTVTTVNIYRERFPSATSDVYASDGRRVHAEHRRETFTVRFAKPVTRDYLRTRHGFVFADRGAVKLAAAWTADIDRRSSFEQFDALDRAGSTADAMRALATYPGPPQNFVVADDGGRAGYTLAGEIPIDPAWGLVAHDGPRSGPPRQPNVPFPRLPHVAPARDAIVFTANDRMYGAGYPYRLSAAFSPPYRAARIAQHLSSRHIDVATFETIQADVFSLPERDLAMAGVRALDNASARDEPDLAVARTALRTFDGRFVGHSRGAVFVTALRRAATERIVRLHMPRELALRYLSSDAGEAFVAVMRMLRERPHGWVPGDDYDAFLVASMRDGIAGLRARGQFDATWDKIGERVAQHPLAGLGLRMWNGTRFPGLGDAYSPHVQAPANAQSFRAVWDIGNWDAGGMVIPQGESGEPGSPHYRDLAPAWLAGTLVPLPFGDAAVARVARERLVLTAAR
jgi:penicillin amidase